MEIKASLKHLRIAPKKVRLVAHLIKGLSIDKADEQLQFSLKGSATNIKKLLKSAVANAINNKHLKKENLYIKNVIVNEGIALKRWKPRAMGRAAQIKKRASHIMLVLAEKSKPKIKKEIKNNSANADKK